MIKTITYLLLIGFVVLSVVGCSQQVPNDIPPQVLESYGEIKERYKDSLGSWLDLCVKDDEKIYRVMGSGGYSGETIYFTENGESLGVFIWDDVMDDDELQLPINESEFSCKSLKKDNNSVLT